MKLRTTPNLAISLAMTFFWILTYKVNQFHNPNMGSRKTNIDDQNGLQL